MFLMFNPGMSSSTSSFLVPFEVLLEGAMLLGSSQLDNVLCSVSNGHGTFFSELCRGKAIQSPSKGRKKKAKG